MEMIKYFNEKEIELLKLFCIKQDELIALNDNYMREYPCIGFEYYFEDGGSVYITNPFGVYGEECEVDPVDYYGNYFIESKYTEIGEGIDAMYSSVNGELLYSAKELDILKRIFDLDKLIEKYNY